MLTANCSWCYTEQNTKLKIVSRLAKHVNIVVMDASATCHFGLKELIYILFLYISACPVHVF